MLTIGGLSQQTGCHIETIRYYEKIGLLPKPNRSEGGHRLYGADQIKRLAFIRRCRELGFALEDIRGLLALVDGRRYTCQQVKAVTERHLESIREKVVDLRILDKTLAGIAARCQGTEAPDCPIIDILFEGKHL
jgi:MerR family mercuric resistance operon transcriptional regulator